MIAAAFDEIEALLIEHGSANYRDCLVCGETLTFVLVDGRPVLRSCGCRPENSSRFVDKGWSDLKALLEKRK